MNTIVYIIVKNKLPINDFETVEYREFFNTG